MKKLFLLFEDLWVAVAFLEAGVSYHLDADHVHPPSPETVRMRTV